MTDKIQITSYHRLSDEAFTALVKTLPKIANSPVASDMYFTAGVHFVLERLRDGFVVPTPVVITTYEKEVS